MTVAARIADVNTKKLTDPGERYEHREVRGLTLRITSGGSRKWDFNGRFDGKRIRVPIGDYTDVTVE